MNELNPGERTPLPTRLVAVRRGRLEVAGKDVTMPLILSLVVVALALIANPLTNGVFFTANNLTNLMRQMTITGLLSLGMLFVILTGGIDLSVGSVVGFSAIIAAGAAVHWGFPVWASFLVGIVTGACWGLVSGSLVA